MFPSLILLVRALLDYDIYDYTFLFEPFAEIFLVTITAAYLLCREMIKHAVNRSTAVVTLVFCMSCFSYGSTIFLNSYYDKTLAQVFSVAVKDKHKSSGKYTTYYLNVEAWGRYTTSEDVSVPSKLYSTENIGDTVNIYLKKGSLGIPWFYVDHRKDDAFTIPVINKISRAKMRNIII